MKLKPSIVIPVFNRTAELRLALKSLVGQTVTDFECLVVDDASQIDIAAVVAEFDERFTYLRTAANGGPSAARILGFERVSGDFLLLLDSDNELFPWCLERAAHYLATYPTTSGVSGLYMYPDGLRVRVRDSPRVITPTDYAASGSSHHDMVGAVRAEVVSEWLGKRHDYYAAEFHQWLTYHLGHDHLVVDEPWGRYNEGQGPRVSRSADERGYADVRVFIEDHQRALASTPCRPLDDYLLSQWVTLRRAGRSEVHVVEEWMAQRGLKRSTALVKAVERRLRRNSAAVDVL